jgi:hypothetical protein
MNSARRGLGFSMDFQPLNSGGLESVAFARSSCFLDQFFGWGQETLNIQHRTSNSQLNVGWPGWLFDVLAAA